MSNKINKQNQQNYPITRHLLFWGNTGKQLELKRLQFRNAADYIYAFSRRFYPKWLQVIHIFFVSMCSLEIEPTTFALLT